MRQEEQRRNKRGGGGRFLILILVIAPPQYRTVFPGFYTNKQTTLNVVLAFLGFRGDGSLFHSGRRRQAGARVEEIWLVLHLCAVSGSSGWFSAALCRSNETPARLAAVVSCTASHNMQTTCHQIIQQDCKLCCYHESKW